MSKYGHVKEIILLSIFLVASFGVGIVSFTTSNQQARNTTAAQAASNVDNYCRNGVYYVKDPKDPSKEISCGRGACGGVSYTGTAGIDWKSNGKCWVGNGKCGPACSGQVPLCCYKMAETGDAEACPFPERGYCMKEQCEKQTQDSACGNQQGAYCVRIDKCVQDRGEIPYISLEDRVAGKTGSSVKPTNTSTPPTQIPATNSPQQNSPIPTQTKPSSAPLQPTTNTQNPNLATTPVAIEPTQQVQQPTPTSSFVFNFGNTNETGNFDNGQQQNNQPALQNENKQSLAFSFPQIEVKSPQQTLRETINQSTVEKLNQATDKPLAVAKNSFITVKTYDQKLENTIESWIFQIRIAISKFLQ